MKFQVKRVHNQAKLPNRAYDSVGYDCWPTESGTIPARGKVRIPLGFKAQFDRGFVALLEDKSGMGFKGQTKLAGVIDPDYRGEWAAIIHNTTDEPFSYSPEKSIIQILFFKVEEPQPEWVDELSETERGEKGFGSSVNSGGRVIEAELSLQSKPGVKTN